MIRSPRSARSGVASVEMALVMNFVVVPLMIGVWEMGRVVQVQQIVSNAAREGARLAGQAKTINSTGDPTQIADTVDPNPLTPTAPRNPGDLPNVKDAVFQSLVGAGLTNLTWSDVAVTFQYMDSPAGATAGPTTTGPQPSAGVKNQRFRVTVTLNQTAYNKVRWVNLGLVNPTSISYTVEWRMLVDDAFTVNATLPVW